MTVRICDRMIKIQSNNTHGVISVVILFFYFASNLLQIIRGRYTTIKLINDIISAHIIVNQRALFWRFYAAVKISQCCRSDNSCDNTSYYN